MTRATLIDWAERQTTGLAGRKLLLLLLARRADEHRACRITEQDLAQVLECTPRNVRNLISALVDRGLLAVQRRHCDTNTYLLLADEPTLAEPGFPSQKNPATCDNTENRKPGSTTYRCEGLGSPPPTHHPGTGVPPGGYQARRSSSHAVAFITDIIVSGRLAPDQRQFATLARQVDAALAAGYSLLELRSVLNASLASARDAIKTMIWRLKAANLHRVLRAAPATTPTRTPQPATSASAPERGGCRECRQCRGVVKLAPGRAWDGLCQSCLAPRPVSAPPVGVFSWRALARSLGAGGGALEIAGSPT